MRISRLYRVDDWRQLSFAEESDWQRGVDILKDRLDTRYLEHIRALLQRPTSGFVVLALDSLLIETLEQFHRGTRKTPQKRGLEYFQSFFARTAFKDHFDAVTARLFYITIRCGLLHQAEAEGNSRIKRDGALVALTTGQQGIVVNRQRFHGLLEAVIENYYAELRNPKATERRQAFKRKMNYICRIEEVTAVETG